jgi:DNA-binding XRE family transcriptional regulator
MGSEEDQSRDALAAVQLRAEFEFPLGELVQLPSPQFWNQVIPERDSAGGDPDGPSGNRWPSLCGVEVRQYVFFEHALQYSMLTGNANHAIEPDLYPIRMETMGDRIRTLRQARGLSQSQLAERVGVTAGAVSQWENGNTQNIKIPTYLKLCTELGTTPHYLALGPNHKPPVLPPGRRQA